MHDTKKSKVDEENEYHPDMIAELNDIKERIVEFLKDILPEGKQQMGLELESMPIDDMIEKFKKNILGMSYVRQLIRFPVKKMMDKAQLTEDELKGGAKSIEKFIDLLLEACAVLKKYK